MQTYTDDDHYVCKVPWTTISGTVLFMLLQHLISNKKREFRDWSLAIDEGGFEFRFKDMITAYKFADKFKQL